MGGVGWGGGKRVPVHAVISAAMISARSGWYPGS